MLIFYSYLQYRCPETLQSLQSSIQSRMSILDNAFYIFQSFYFIISILSYQIKDAEIK